MSKQQERSAASVVDEMAAEIMKRARPMLTEEEQEKVSREQAAQEARYAAAKCRAAAETQLARAEEWDQIASDIEQKG